MGRFIVQKNTFFEGIGLRLLSVFLITAMSAVVHKVAQSVPVGQIMFWRSGFALLVICLYVMWRRDFPAGIRTKRPMLHVTRGLLGAFTMALSFLSLAYLPVANAQAIAYLAPIFTLPLAAFFLKERLTVSVIFAVGLGFGGVMFLLWDTLELPGEGAIIGIGAALGYALTMAFVRVHTKTMTHSESSTAIAFYFALTAMVFGLCTAPFGWEAVQRDEIMYLIAAGVLGGVGHIVSNKAVARAQVSTLAPFDFTGLIWALGFDLLFFQVFPSAFGLVGMVLITCAAMGIVLVRAPREERNNVTRPYVK
ncbi:DMT family transporter [Tritonibacter aquimaris]